jgi:glycogen synthase
MRIVLVSPEYTGVTRAGGIGTVTSIVASGLARRGHDTHVITRGAPGSRRDGEVGVIAVRHRWVPNRVAFELLARRRIAAAAVALGPDVVQASEWKADAWWLARRHRVPVVTRLDTPTYLVELLNRGAVNPKGGLLRRMERDQTRSSASVIAPSASLAERVSIDWRLGPDRVEVIPNPVDVARIREMGATTPTVELPARFVAFFGRIEPRKGVGVLGTALPAVLAAHPEVHVMMIGADPGVDAGRFMEGVHRDVARVRDRVHFVGELSRAQALAIVARAAVVALPSLWENFGYTCLEAMALGRPVVATRTGGFLEIVEEGRSGWLVPPGDAAVLANRLTSVLGDASLLERVGQGARRRAEDFDIEPITDRLVDLYERVVAAHSTRTRVRWSKRRQPHAAGTRLR